MLKDWGEGDQDAPARLMPLIYDELRQRAAAYLRAGTGGPYPAGDGAGA